MIAVIQLNSFAKFLQTLKNYPTVSDLRIELDKLLRILIAKRDDGIFGHEIIGRMKVLK
jgi:hypothetical protein